MLFLRGEHLAGAGGEVKVALPHAPHQVAGKTMVSDWGQGQVTGPGRPFLQLSEGVPTPS